MAKIPKNMKLTAVVQKWLDELEWKDEISIDKESQTSLLKAILGDDGQQYNLFVEADEGKQWLMVYIYGPIGIPPDRYDEACKLANGINQRSNMGRICAIKEGNFQYHAAVDVEGGALVPHMIENMRMSGLFTFRNWTKAMGQVIFAGTPADKIFEELDKAKEEPQEDAVPDKL